MILKDQPTIFPDNLTVRISSVADGSMRGSDAPSAQSIENYTRFLNMAGVAPEQTVRQGITYTGDDYCRYYLADETNMGLQSQQPIFADGIVVKRSEQAIFLPLADCTGAVFYDSTKKILMVSHLGRHSTEQHGAKASVIFMGTEFGCLPRDIIVWLSPSPNGIDYPLWQRDNQSFSDANYADLIAAGIRPENIEVSSVDTITNSDYYSHSEFLKGKQPTDGRYAIVATMR